MDVMKIRGGNRLEGTVRASGAKNAITKMLVASMIADTQCVFTNVPAIEEVENTLHLLQQIGMVSQWDKERGELIVQTKELTAHKVEQRFSGANRIPILLLGALLGRTNQEVIVPAVGGCKIGKRPVDFHITALEQLGAKIDEHQEGDTRIYVAHAPKGLSGCHIELPFPSVGATENVLLAAIRAKGTTTITNCAIEPEVIDIITFLQKLGVRIHIAKDRTIVIKETTSFYPTQHEVLSDRIEIASLAMAALSTKGKVHVENARPETLTTFLAALRDANAHFEVKDNGITFFLRGPLKGGLHVETDVHPGFLTDWQQPFAVLLSQAKGHSVIHETIYENRFGYTKTLNDMGADMELFTTCLGSVPCRFQQKHFQHSLTIRGPTPLHAKSIAIPDLRAGFAYVMAALIAEGTSTISNLHYLDRGYERLDKKLLSLGADLKRVKGSDLVENLLGEKSSLPV